MRLPLLLLFATAACTVEGGQEYDPPEGSETIHFDANTGVLSLNTDIVPVVEDCQGELRVGPDGWVCERPTVGWERIDHRTDVFHPNPHQHRFEDITEVPPSLPPAPHGHSWQELTGLPEAFAPAAHAHGLAEVAISEQDTWPGQATWNAIEGQPGAFPVAGHSHSWESLSNRPEVFPASAHEHPWQQVINKPTELPPSAHGHLLSEVNIGEQGVFPGRTEWERVDHRPEVFKAQQHDHQWSEITSRPATYPVSAHTHGFATLEGRPEAFPPTDHDHGWNDLSEVPETFPPDAHGHQWSAITGVTASTVWPGRTPVGRITDFNTRAADAIAGSYVWWENFGTSSLGQTCGPPCGPSLFDCCMASICNAPACFAWPISNFEPAPDYQTPQAKKIGDLVHLRGVVRRKGSDEYVTNEILFTMASGFRPSDPIHFVVSTGQFSRAIEIRPDGNVVFLGGMYESGLTSLSGIVFSTAE